MPTLIITADPVSAAHATSTLIADALATAAPVGQAIHVALAGGATPRRVYEHLAESVLDWAHVHLWLGDERVVPFGDPDSNAAMIASTLVDRTALAPDHFHPMPTQLGAAAACDAYEQSIRTALPGDLSGVPVFDLILLGLGEDAHTASLFPNSAGLTSQGKVCVVELAAPKPPPERISLTLQTLAAARTRLVLATGAAKADALTAALEGEPSPHAPASLLPKEGTTWVVDEAAAAALDIGTDRP